MFKATIIKLAVCTTLLAPSYGVAGGIVVSAHLLIDVKQPVKADSFTAALKGGGSSDNSGSGSSGSSGHGRGGRNSGSDDHEDEATSNSGHGGTGSSSDDSSGSGDGVQDDSHWAQEDIAATRQQIDRVEIDTSKITIYYKNGWMESLGDRIYELRDKNNRRVIRRRSTLNDARRFDQLLGR